MQELQATDHRRSILWFLLYDSDYQLSESMLLQCFEARGKNISTDQLKTQSQWLSEQGLVFAKQTGGVESLTLTDRGLDVAKGKVKAIGVRNLRPSELADIRNL